MQTPKNDERWVLWALVTVLLSQSAAIIANFMISPHFDPLIGLLGITIPVIALIWRDLWKKS